MPYQEETIKTIIDRLNTQYFLPSIQRHYVWKPDGIILLFDSIMRGYPISSFLFWEISSENREKWDVYKFAEIANSEGTSHIKLPSADGIQNLTLVLDGQQRLTSMLIGLKGTYLIRKRYQRANHFGKFPENRLYFDLFEDPTPRDDDQEFTGKPYYGFKFFDKEPENSADHHWIRVGKILDCHDDNAFYKMKDEEETSFPAEISKARENQFERNLWRLYQAIWKDAAISYYIERDQDYDRVLDIFIRANEAGTELTKAEVLMAMLTSKWGINAKDQIESFILYLNNQLNRKNDFGIEFVMRTSLILAGLPVRYRINNFTNQAISDIEKNWGAMQSAMERTVRLVNSFGIDKNNLTSRLAIIPLIYYAYLHPGVSFLGSDTFETKNALRMRRWLLSVLLNNVFGRVQEQLLANTRRVLNEHKSEEDFPLKALNDELIRMRFRVDLDEKAFLSASYGGAFLQLSMLYDDEVWRMLPNQQDHIFPQSLFSDANPEFEKLSAEQKARYHSLMNRMGNLELLLEHENNEKRAKPFDEWIKTRDATFRQRHLIPPDDALLQFENFEQFMQEREALIVERLKKYTSADTTV